MCAAGQPVTTLQLLSEIYALLHLQLFRIDGLAILVFLGLRALIWLAEGSQQARLFQ